MRPAIRRSIAVLMVAAFVSIPLTARGNASIVRRYIYLPEALPAAIDWQGVPAPETITVRTDDGLDIRGYRWPAAVPDHDTIVFFHGNAGNRYTAARYAAPLRRPDAEIIVTSYRGYGDNPGSPDEAGLYRDGAAFLRYARGSVPRGVYLFGFSLGAAVALRLGAEQPVQGVITLGAFSTLRAVAPRWAGIFLPDRFDNLASVRRLQVPLILIHGSADDTVPFAEARKLMAASGDKASLIVLRNGNHDVDLDYVSPAIWTHIEEMRAHREIRLETPPSPHRAGPTGP